VSAVPVWIQGLTSLATPIIAAAVAYIAWRQWKTNHHSLNERLFDRRMEVIQQVQSSLRNFFQSFEISGDQLNRFKEAMEKATFLFDDNLADWMREVHDRMIEVSQAEKEIERLPVGEERTKLNEITTEKLKWLGHQRDIAMQKFRPFMTFK
jgi:hypothetical protein